MRYGLLICSVVLLIAGGAAATVLVSRAGTVANATRECEPSGALSIVFGEPIEREGGTRVVPLFLKNRGNETRRVLVGSWEVDMYRVRWDGRLVPLPSLRAYADLAENHGGEEISPGERYGFGEVQIPAGETHLLAWAAGACGEGRVHV